MEHLIWAQFHQHSTYSFYARSSPKHNNSVGGVVKVEIYEVDTKIELYVDTFWLGL